MDLYNLWWGYKFDKNKLDKLDKIYDTIITRSTEDGNSIEDVTIPYRTIPIIDIKVVENLFKHGADPNYVIAYPSMHRNTEKGTPFNLFLEKNIPD